MWRPSESEFRKCTACKKHLLDHLCAHDFIFMLTSLLWPWNNICHLSFALDFFNLKTRMRISPIQSRTLRRDENLWHLISGFETRPRKMSFNLRHRDRIEIYYLQSQTLRRERESRLRQFSREFTRIWFVVCVWTNIFLK